MKSIEIFTFLVLLWTTIQAQESVPLTIRPVEKTIGFNFGYQYRQLLDEQKSALTYASGEYLAGVFFKREGHQSLFKISLNGGTGDFYAKHFKNRWLYSSKSDIEGNLTTDSLPVTSTLTAGDLQVSYLLKLNPKRRATWLAGATVKEILVYTDNNTGLLNSLGLHANLGFMNEFGKGSRMNVNLSVPLMALNSRLPWHNTASSPIDSEIKTFFKKGTNFSGPGDFHMLDLDIDYEIRVLKGWNIGACYSFTWLNVPTHQPLKSILHTFQIQTSFNL